MSASASNNKNDDAVEVSTSSWCSFSAPLQCLLTNNTLIDLETQIPTVVWIHMMVLILRHTFYLSKEKEVDDQMGPQRLLLNCPVNEGVCMQVATLSNWSFQPEIFQGNLTYETYMVCQAKLAAINNTVLIPVDKVGTNVPWFQHKTGNKVQCTALKKHGGLLIKHTVKKLLNICSYVIFTKRRRKKHCTICV